MKSPTQLSWNKQWNLTILQNEKIHKWGVTHTHNTSMDMGHVKTFTKSIPVSCRVVQHFILISVVPKLSHGQVECWYLVCMAQIAYPGGQAALPFLDQSPLPKKLVWSDSSIFKNTKLLLPVKICRLQRFVITHFRDCFF